GPPPPSSPPARCSPPCSTAPDAPTPPTSPAPCPPDDRDPATTDATWDRGDHTHALPAYIAISQARSPRPGWQHQGIPAPHVNAGAAKLGQPGDVLLEDRSAARHHQRANNQVGQTDEH